MDDRTEPPAAGRLLGWEPTNGPRRVIPGPWPATPVVSSHRNVDRDRDVEPPAAGVFPGRRHVPAPDPDSPFAPRASFAPPAEDKPRSMFEPVPAQTRQGTPPGGWPALGSPANPPARPQRWPEWHETRAANAFIPEPAQPRRFRHLVGYPIAIAASIAVGIAVGATSPGSGSPTGTDRAAAVTPTAAVATATAGAQAGVGAGAPGAVRPDGVHGFGQIVTFADGSTLTAGAPVPFTPGDVAFGGDEFPQHVKVKVTFVNNSDKVFDPALTVGVASSGELEGAPVYQRGLDAPSARVLPGRRVSWWMGYGVADPRKVTLTVRMGFLDYADVTFTNE
jgi:hypothetical protein